MKESVQKTWLVVGASRGIGNEFVRQLLARGERVLATVRDSKATTAARIWPEAQPGQCQLYSCDMLSDASIHAFANNVALSYQGAIDYVVFNAGVLKYPNRATEISYDDFLLHLKTNTIGPIITAQALLKAGAHIGTIVFISSDSGSASQFNDFEDGFAAYGASKAALNQSLRHMAAELRRQGKQTVVLALHPGEVMTDMANIEVAWEVKGQITPAESVEQCLSTIQSKDQADHGTFWTWDNRRHPW